MNPAMKKYRYEFPPLEPHFVESPSADAVLKYVKRCYPHNYDEVLPTLVEIPRWPTFWTVVDEQGRVLPQLGGPPSGSLDRSSGD